MRYLVILSCFILGASSCVSSKKFSDLEMLKEYYKLKNDTLELMKDQNFNINRTLSSTSSNLSQTTAELNTTKASLDQLQFAHDKLNTEYKQLESNIQKLSSSSQNETQSLRGELDKATSENSHMRSILTNLDKTFQINQSGGVIANDTWSNKLSRMQAVSETLQSEQSQIQSIYGLLLDTPLSQQKGLETIYANNKLIVRMGVDDIFRKGTDQLNTLGRKTVEELTGIILRNSNLNIEIEGHSDATGSDSNNWKTSSKRATSVANEMIKNQFMPSRILAIGRSSHHPINPESTSAAQKQNRRIELIIKPRTSL